MVLAFTFFRKPFLLFSVIFLMCGCASSTTSVDTFGSVTDEAYLSYHRGEQAYNFGDYEAAKKNFEEFVNKYPDESLHKIVLYYLGRCYENLNDTAKAKEVYVEAIQKYKGDFWANSAERRLRNLN